MSEEHALTEQRVRGAVGRATGRDAGAAGATAGRPRLDAELLAGGRPARLVRGDGHAARRRSGGGHQGRPARADPFVDVQRYLERIGVRVPAIRAYQEAEGLMVLEDLGDDMLETRLLAGDDRRALYEAAVDQLARLRAAAERAPGGCVAFTRSFDRGLDRWELDHFREWLLEAWKGARLAPDERAELDQTFDGIAAALDAEPKGFTHRDYQSRNVMILPGGEQAVIDFQDALLGPRQYDLVALLRDSYVELPPELVEALLRRWLARFEEAGGPRLAYEPFRAVFDLLTVQPSEAQGRGPLRLHRPREGEPRLPPQHPRLAALRARRLCAQARPRPAAAATPRRATCRSWLAQTPRPPASAMRIALLADVHSNLEGRPACLEHAAPAGPPATPSWGIRWATGPIRGRCWRSWRPTGAGRDRRQGNHDAPSWGWRAAMNSARDAERWSGRAPSSVSATGRSCRGLPLPRRDDALFVHASAARGRGLDLHHRSAARPPRAWRRPPAPRRSSRATSTAGALLPGGPHGRSRVRAAAGVPRAGPGAPRWLAIVGSAGQPRDGTTAAGYIDLRREAAPGPTFFRVPYDVAAAAAKVRRAGLPEALAARLERGL